MSDLVTGVVVDLATLWVVSGVCAAAAAGLWALLRGRSAAGRAAAGVMCWAPLVLAVLAAGWLAVQAVPTFGVVVGVSAATVMVGEGIVATALAGWGIRTLRRRRRRGQAAP